MYHCNLLADEKFYLRLLLTIVCGLQSFEHLCTINGVVHDTFREAAIAVGLTHNNRKWIDTFTEAITFASLEDLENLEYNLGLFLLNNLLLTFRQSLKDYDLLSYQHQ